MVSGYSEKPDTAGALHDEWLGLRTSLRQRFVEKLRSGELVATGFLQPLSPESRRREVPAHLFELLELDYAAAEAKRHNLHFIHVEVAPAARGREPSTGGEAAEGRFTPPAPESPALFLWNERYSHVSIRGHKFTLIGGQCTLIRRLHEASMTEDPWVSTKSLLSEASYRTTTLGGVFRRHTDPSWKKLIEQKRGFSRLNL